MLFPPSVEGRRLSRALEADVRCRKMPEGATIIAGLFLASTHHANPRGSVTSIEHDTMSINGETVKSGVPEDQEAVQARRVEAVLGASEQEGRDDTWGCADGYLCPLHSA